MQKVSRMSKPFLSRRQSGFTMVQMLITIAIIAIVTTFGILGITKARAEMRMQNSARRFAVYVEKARGDSIRRHAVPGSEAWVETFGPTTTKFDVRMDFDGSGTLQTRTFYLDEGISFDTIAQKATFDWRGRIVDALAFQITNGAKRIPVDISGSGDITIDQQIFGDEAIPAITFLGVPPDVATDPPPAPNASATPTPSASPSASPSSSPSPSPNGNGNGNGNPHNSPSPTPLPSPSAAPSAQPSASPSPSPVPPACASSVSDRTLTLSQSVAGQGTKTVLFTLTNASGAHSISVAAAGSGNPLNLSVSPASLNGNGSATVTIGAKSGSGNRGSFTVNISASPSCGATQQVTVTVGN